MRGVAGTLHLEFGHGTKQFAGVLMLGVFVDGLGGGGFDDLSLIHDENEIADVLHHGEVVSDKEIESTRVLPANPATD